MAVSGHFLSTASTPSSETTLQGTPNNASLLGFSRDIGHGFWSSMQQSVSFVGFWGGCLMTHSLSTAYYITQPDSLLSKGHLVMFQSGSLQGQPGLCVRPRKDIWCHVWSYSFLCVQILSSDIRLHVKWAVSLVIADGHLIFLRAVCGCAWVNTLTLSPKEGAQCNRNY